MTFARTLCVLIALMAFQPLSAKPLTVEDVPAPLKPWVKWALHGQEEVDCPFLYNSKSHRCAWPARLSLQLNNDGGSFTQQWLMLQPGWAPLPGELQRWPQDVTVNREPAKIGERGGVPGIYLPAGFHVVEGKFGWEALPDSLQLPRDTGLVDIRVKGETVLLPKVDTTGRLWLRARDTERGSKEGIRNTLDVQVFRRIVDDIPLRVITRVELDVSGEHREVLLGPAMLPGYVPIVLASPLPARLEPDGQLRVQVRPGRWTLVLTTRNPNPVDTIALGETDGLWVEEEVWVFEARNHLRLVSIEGLESIDPRQTSLPSDWQSLPAYRVRPDDVLRFKLKRRGDPEPEPDKLTLQRNLWLDFDGAGYTVQDQIAGTMTQSWRLEVSDPMNLGRVTVDGQPQFITRLEESQRDGVELRRGRLSLTADSRLEDSRSEIPTVGWDHDFQKVNARLNLPPGWRLLAAGGVDRIQDSWVTRWSLLDLFLVLIVAAVVGKLWGWRWGGVALLALGLIYHEPGAPRQVWLHVLAAAALLRVLPGGRFERLIRLYRNVSLVALAVIALPFSVDQVRVALFPQLEQPSRILGATPPSKRPARRGGVAEESVRQEQATPSVLDRLSESPRLAGRGAPVSKLPRLYGDAAVSQLDPKANIQTGPGLPTWGWRTVRLTWNGPVERDQTLNLVLLSPGANLVLRVMSVGLLALLALCVAGLTGGRGGGPLTRFGRAAKAGPVVPGVLVLSLSGGAAFVPGVAEADIPSDALLKQLRARLLEAPECLPQCAQSQRMRLEVRENTLRARIEVHTLADVAVPLPGQQGQFEPRAVHLETPAADGEGTIGWETESIPETFAASGTPAPALFRDPEGVLWVRLPKGRHQILLEGPLPRRATVQIALPLKPHNLVANVQGWILEGLHENGLADDQLQLTRTESQPKGDSAALPALEPDVLPPFLRVERTLRLGLDWDVDTRVVRVSPPGTAVVLEIPLLKGEAVTSGGVRVEHGNVLVNMAPQIRELQWRSVLDKTELVQLTAPQTSGWTEVWRLDASPIWHVLADGIPVVHHQNQGRWLPEWRPWPGESATLRVSRPLGVAGRTLTLDETKLTVKPGRRATDAALSLSLRSSQGGQHSVVLPESARLQSVTIDGKSQPIRQEGRSVTLPLKPGTQNAQLTWRESAGMKGRFLTPAIDLGTRSVNATIQLEVPRNRWVLFTSGPTAGPAVMFWGVLIVIIVVAAGLARTRRTPLRTRHWVLLGLGLSQVLVWFALIIVGWLFALDARRQIGEVKKTWQFNLMQVTLGVLTLLALALLFHTVQQGLLGWPDMQIAGNGSHGYLLRWFQDRSAEALPSASVISVPTAVYRFLMLAWALWLAFALIRWLRWGWACYSAGGIWRSVKLVRPGVKKGRGRISKDDSGAKTDPEAT